MKDGDFLDYKNDYQRLSNSTPWSQFTGRLLTHYFVSIVKCELEFTKTWRQFLRFSNFHIWSHMHPSHGYINNCFELATVPDPVAVLPRSHYHSALFWKPFQYRKLVQTARRKGGPSEHGVFTRTLGDQTPYVCMYVCMYVAVPTQESRESNIRRCSTFLIEITVIFHSIKLRTAG
jgi:hypothetical protein